MTDTRLLIGTDVRCTDGACGRLQRIIADPLHTRLTYLAVRPDGLAGGRLVPADPIASAAAEIHLRCTTAEFARLEPAEETSPQHTASWPYASDEQGGRFPAGLEGIERDTGYGNRTVTSLTVNACETESREAITTAAAPGEGKPCGQRPPGDQAR